MESCTPFNRSSCNLRGSVGCHCLRPWLQTNPDVYIVVHSTWRYEYTEPELRQMLGSLGRRFVGCAPRAPRQQAIEMVLQSNRGLRGHLVLDDDPREFCGSKLNVLLLDPQRGLSDEAAQSAIRNWLRSTPSDSYDGP
jgi:hypothetical protein